MTFVANIVAVSLVCCLLLSCNQQTVSAPTWHTVTDPTGTISLSMPGLPIVYAQADAQLPSHLQTVSFTDHTYLFEVIDLDPQSFAKMSQSKISVLDQLCDTQINLLDKHSRTVSHTIIHGVDARSISGHTAVSNQPSLHVEGLILLKGTTLIQLKLHVTAESWDKHKQALTASADIFFNSLNITPNESHG